MRQEYDYWFFNAVEKAVTPTLAVVDLFFCKDVEQQTGASYSLIPKNHLAKIPYFIFAGAVLLITLPADLFIATALLPPAALHDLFAFMSNCYYSISELVNNNLDNYYLPTAAMATSCATLLPICIINQALEGNDICSVLARYLTIAVFFIATLPIDIIVGAIALPIAFAHDVFQLIADVCDANPTENALSM